jgi:hypothetical protein
VTSASTGAELGTLIADSRGDALESAQLMAESKGISGERFKVRRVSAPSPALRPKAPRSKARRIVEFTLASQDETEKLAEPTQKVLEALGHREAAVSDESHVCDFLEQEGVRPYCRGRDEQFLARREGAWRWMAADLGAPRRNARKIRRLEERLGVPVDRKELLTDVARKVRDMGRS